MSQKPVDIIMPTFLGGKHVCDVTGQPMIVTALQSLLACGEYYPVRIILVDNGNQDLESHDERVRVIKMRRNGGWERALIEGLKVSDAEYVVFANDDIRSAKSAAVLPLFASASPPPAPDAVLPLFR